MKINSTIYLIIFTLILFSCNKEEKNQASEVENQVEKTVFDIEKIALVAEIPFSKYTQNYDENIPSSKPYIKFFPLTESSFLFTTEENPNTLKLISLKQDSPLHIKILPEIKQGIIDFCTFNGTIYYLLKDRILFGKPDGKISYLCKIQNDSNQYSEISANGGQIIVHGRKNTLFIENKKTYSFADSLKYFSKTKKIEYSIEPDFNSLNINLKSKKDSLFEKAIGFDEEENKILTAKFVSIRENNDAIAILNFEDKIDSINYVSNDYIFLNNLTIFNNLSSSKTLEIPFIKLPDSKNGISDDRFKYLNGSLYYTINDSKKTSIYKISKSFENPSLLFKDIVYTNIKVHEEINDGESSIKTQLKTFINKTKNHYSLLDVDAFISYIPDSIENFDKKRKKLLLKKIRGNLKSLVNLYKPYDERINANNDNGIIRSAFRYVERVWIFNPNFKKPKKCHESNSKDCWEIPQDLDELKEPKRVEGIPYCWGGKKQIDDHRGNGFINDISKGLAPGDVCTSSQCSNKGLCENNQTTGIDCSGLVVNSFKINEDLKGKNEIQGTNNLSRTERFLKIGNSLAQLQKGDILLNPGSHVMICVEKNRNYCKIVHSSKGSFGTVLKGLKHGSKLDSVGTSTINSVFKRGYYIYRLNLHNYSFKPYQDWLSSIIYSTI